MLEKSLQKLDRELNKLIKSQDEHLVALERRIARHEVQINGIERTVIGEPHDSRHEVTAYIDKHGF